MCNTYCDPCAKVHPELKRLLEGGTIDLQIIFFPNGIMDGLHAKIISHLLPINSKGDTKVMQEALDHWYTAEKKDYADFPHATP